MANATLRIHVEGGADLRRMLGQVGRDSKRANDGIAADARQQARVLLGLAKARIQEEGKAARERMRIEARAGQESTRGEQRRTRTVQQEAEKRAKAEEKAQLKITREAANSAKAHEREEANKTRATEREAAKRSAAEERAARSVSRAAAREARRLEREYEGRVRSAGQNVGAVAGSVFGGAASFAGDYHSQRQAARQGRAGSEHAMNAALYQAGASAADAAPLRARIYDYARRNGMDSGQLAEAINAAQTEFSSLGTSRSTQAQRSTNLESLLSSATLARNTYQDPGEVMRISGMLQNSGMDADTRQRTLLSLTGFAQQGAIELGAVTRTAMAPMQARIGQALQRLGPDATAEQRQVATQRAVAQTFGEMEVGRGLGFTPRVMGNVTRDIGNALQSTTTQQNMLTNIRNAYGQNSEQERALFEDDPTHHGRSRLRSQFTDALGLSEGLSSAFHGDATAMMNVFKGGGHGNPQSLQANWRNVLGAFMGGDVEGVTGSQRVRQMIAGAGTAFTQLDVDRGAQMVEGETQTTLARDNETREGALTENTSALGKLSDVFNSWVARNPTAAMGLQAGSNVAGGIFGSLFAGGLARRAGGALLGAAPGAAAAAGGAGILARIGGGLRTLGVGATGVGAAAAAGLGAGMLGTGIIDAAQGHTDEGVNFMNAFRTRRGSSGQRGQSYWDEFKGIFRGSGGAESVHAQVNQSGTQDLARAVAALTQQLQSGQIRATVTLPDAVHAAAEGAGPAGPGPSTPPGR